MGWASCYEDNMDAKGETERSKSRKPKVQIGKNRLKKQYVPVTKTRHVPEDDPEDDICFESLLNSLPVPQPDPPRRPKPSPKTRQHKTLRSKPSPKTRQHTRRRERRKEQYAPVTKTRYVTSEEIQRRIQREIIRLN